MTDPSRSLAPGLDWLESGRRVIACTLVRTVGSAPLDPGAEMIVDGDLAIEGSVTGGCVESALVQEARGILAGEPPRVIGYGISEDEAAGVGLLCGGKVEVFVHELGEGATDALEEARGRLAAGEPVALATMLDGPSAGAKLAAGDGFAAGSLGRGERFDELVARDASALMEHGQTAVRSYGSEGEVLGAELRVHVQAFSLPPRLVIVGAIDFSAAVAVLAGELGYRVTICDPRAPFASSPRYSSVAEVAVEWPDQLIGRLRPGPRDIVLVFTHDPKFDRPALGAALESEAGYIGALGSRRTQAERLRRLREDGWEQSELDRISGPCGLDIGARTPAETAVSIMAEVIAVANDRPGGGLAGGSAPIHPRRAEIA